MQKIISLALLALVGCGGTSTTVVPPTAGDFVKNDDGIGTASVFGINFSARLKSSGTSANDAIDANFVDAKKSSAQKRFTLGDEITIELESINESKVRFIFSERDFGTLSVRDKVMIDD